MAFAIVGAAIGVYSLLSGRADAKKAAGKEKQIGALNARIEKINAQSASLERTQRLHSALSSNVAEFAARGIDVGTGSPVTQAKSDRKKYEMEQILAAQQTQLQQQAFSAGAQARASAMVSNANTSLISGVGSLISAYGQTRT